MITISNEQGLRLSWNCNVFFFITFLHISRHSKSFGANFRFANHELAGNNFWRSFLNAYLHSSGYLESILHFRPSPPWVSPFCNLSFWPIMSTDNARLRYFFPNFYLIFAHFGVFQVIWNPLFVFTHHDLGRYLLGDFWSVLPLYWPFTFSLWRSKLYSSLRSIIFKFHQDQSTNQRSTDGRTDGWTDSSMDRGCGGLE